MWRNEANQSGGGGYVDSFIFIHSFHSDRHRYKRQTKNNYEEQNTQPFGKLDCLIWSDVTGVSL